MLSHEIFYDSPIKTINDMYHCLILFLLRLALLFVKMIDSCCLSESADRIIDDVSLAGCQGLDFFSPRLFTWVRIGVKYRALGILAAAKGETYLVLNY